MPQRIRIDTLSDTYNAGYLQAVYQEYLRDPESVDESWRRLFASDAAARAGFPAREAAGPAAPPARAQLRAAMAAGELVDAYRLHGHAAARLDPLGGRRPGHPMLDPTFHGISREDLTSIPAALLGFEHAGRSMAEVLEWLEATYTGTIGYEYEHLESPERREWLREQIESGVHARPLAAEQKKRLLSRLTDVEAFEQFLHRAYLGQKRFSVEGTDVLVPMLELAIERAAAAGAREVVLGMAHRGRLNVLVHVIGRPYTAILAEFEKQHAGTGTTGDVKYHLGAEGAYTTAAGQQVRVTLLPNPSHLEFVNPVVEGIARARQTRQTGTVLERDENTVLPVLIHGDAAFSGQGVVAETLNLAELAGYRTGGTLHLIVNNQVGFTTLPREGRSTDYASDLARGFDIPIFHVNADDPQAALAVTRLALAYRERFHGDVLLDLIGYRRYGHNEGDEPAYTQPVMYATIEGQAPVRRLWAEALVAEGVVTAEEVKATWDAAHQRLIVAQDEVRRAGEANGGQSGPPPPEPATLEPPVDTAVPAELLLELDQELHRWPADFAMNPKLGRQLQRRAGVLGGDGAIDWGHAEALALASLLAEGTPIRLSGQDTARGTFSQRHLLLFDVKTGAAYCPLAHLSRAQAPLEVFNTPLSEISTLGFEYGYSTVASDTLVLWEAQFGDFTNVAQVVIDQFMAAGRAKWGQTSRLVLLLPHGYEGQGPEHSSARPERFLQLAAEDNIRVANCTTPAQYFHLLRRQALLEELRPLVIFAPKSLLRHPQATSRLADLAEGRFHMVLDDAAAQGRRAEVTRVALCTGKFYYDLTTSEQRAGAGGIAVVRLEQLYPFPEEELARILAGYPALQEVVWVQEEPENMGAWRYMEPRLRVLAGTRLELGYIGRPDRASPAEGYAIAHEQQQAAIIQAALTTPRRARRARTA